jgi:tripartite-type tricarboxylate transporter receptor subunit TctC
MISRRTLGASALAVLATPALAQWQPTRPIRILVGFAPGGGTDITTRTIGAKLQSLLGQPIVVENRPGAGGNLASEATVNAPNDGHALMMGTIASLVMNPIMARLPFDVLTDLTAIGRSVEVTNVLVVSPDRPWRSLSELIAAAKARPGTLSYGSSGVGGAGHLGGALLDSMAGIETIHVPYRGGGQLITDILSGKVDFSVATAATVLPHIEAGRLRALAVPFARRSALLPDVPTVAEAANLPGYEVANWYAMMGPRGLPRPVVDRVNAALNEAMRDPEVAANLGRHGLEPAPSTPEQLTGFIRAETAKWRPIIERAGASTN